MAGQGFDGQGALTYSDAQRCIEANTRDGERPMEPRHRLVRHRR